MNTIIPFQKNTLQEHTEHLFIFCRLVWIPKQPINFSAQTGQKRQNLENFAFSTTTLRSFEDFFEETTDVFLKTPIANQSYPIGFQSFLNCKIDRNVYKNVHIPSEIRKQIFH